MSKRFKDSFFIWICFIFDVVLIYLSFSLAYWARFYLPIIPVTKGIPPFIAYQKTIPIIIVIFVLIFRQYGLYNFRKYLDPFDEFFRAIKAVTIGTFLAMAATFIYREFSYSRIVLAYAWLISILLIYSFREWIKGIKGLFLRRELQNRGILIMGEGEAPQKVGKTFQERGFKTYTGQLLREESLSNFIKENKIDEVIVTEPIDHQYLWSIVNQCEATDVDFKLVPDILELRLGEIIVDNRLGIPTITLKSPPLAGINLFVKRILDLFLSTTLLLLLSPLLVITGILIRLDSPGPILYCQPRMGYKKKVFSFLKFRTMVENADKMIEEIKHLSDREGPAFKMKDDPRITRVGKWLRRFSLDELPQLMNVLKGDMSLVGPRPQVLWEAAHYDEWASRRLKIPPGITGLWQISGRSELSYEEMIKLDLYYLENWSLELDLKILLKTIPAVLTGKGAY